ncbi:MAG: SDR family oxidoreductase [Actinobacteria bacterium]|nr:SDR family oxidoreductase [Actinomycetota bacterium]
MQLHGKVALVTGGGQGIGQAVAERYAREGAAVVVADLNLPAAQQVAAGIQSSGGRAAARHADVRDSASVRAMFDAAEGHFGPVDIVVNNAGIGGAKALAETTVDYWDTMFAVNVRGVFLGVQEAARRMAPRKQGVIINMASAAGKIGRSYMTCYCATKHAVIGITRAAAHELAPHGIRVNALCPGIVETALWKQLDQELTPLEGRTDGTAWQRRVATIPMGRHEVPADVANAAVLLASADASYITGQAISVDGGMVMS